MQSISPAELEYRSLKTPNSCVLPIFISWDDDDSNITTLSIKLTKLTFLEHSTQHQRILILSKIT